MKLALTRLSLRARIFATVGIVSLPLAATAIGAAVTLGNTVYTLDQAIVQSADRLDTAVRLQSRILSAEALTGDRTVAAGPRPASPGNEVRAAEAAFDEMLDSPSLRPRERMLVGKVRHEWRSEFVRRTAMLARPSAAQNPTQAVHILGALADAYRHESEALRSQIEAGTRRLRWIVSAAVIACLSVAAAGGALLARSVLQPLRALERGVARFADDELSYRLPAEDNDEIGGLARAFNRMAERLETHRNELRELSTHDPLTGLFNRREFEQRLQTERRRAVRYGRPFSLLMLDVDHFKDINDRYGHPCGDEVLTTLADLLRLNVRPMDAVCRYGGEEFAAILPETGRDGALVLAERIRRTVQDSTIVLDAARQVRATVSIGVATFATDAADGGDVVAAADRALYRAKHGGRNRVLADG